MHYFTQLFKLGNHSLKAIKTSAVSSVSLGPPTVTKAPADRISLPLQPQKSPTSPIGLTTASNMKSQQKSSSGMVIPPSANKNPVSSMQREPAKSRRTSIIT